MLLICFLFNFSPIISRHPTSDKRSSLDWVSSLSSSSSSSTTPLKAIDIFLHPFTNYFFSNLSSILASLNLASIEFSLLILCSSLFLPSVSSHFHALLPFAANFHISSLPAIGLHFWLLRSKPQLEPHHATPQLVFLAVAKPVTRQGLFAAADLLWWG